MVSGNTGVTCTFPGPSVAGNLLTCVIQISIVSASTIALPTVTPPAGWVLRGNDDSAFKTGVSTFLRDDLFAYDYPNNPGGISSATFAVTTDLTNGDCAALMLEWANVQSAPYEAIGNAATGSTAATSLTATLSPVPSLTPGLGIAGDTGDAAAWAIPSGWTLTDTYAGFNSSGGRWFHRIYADGSAAEASITMSGTSTQGILQYLSYQAMTGGGGGAPLGNAAGMIGLASQGHGWGGLNP
jgi:hypothetical protein